MTWKVKFKFSDSDFYFGTWLDEELTCTLAHLRFSLLPQFCTITGLISYAWTPSLVHPNSTHTLCQQLPLGSKGMQIGSLVQMNRFKQETHTGLRTNSEIFGREFLGPWYPEYDLEGCEKIPGDDVPLAPEALHPMRRALYSAGSKGGPFAWI